MFLFCKPINYWFCVLVSNGLSRSNWNKLLQEIQVLKCLRQDVEIIYHLDFELEHSKELSSSCRTANLGAAVEGDM